MVSQILDFDKYFVVQVTKHKIHVRLQVFVAFRQSQEGNATPQNRSAPL